MRRWDDVTEVPSDLGPTAVTIGVFDGVHRGHQRVIGRTVEQARAHGAKAVVVTFDPHPTAVVRPDAVPPLLATVDRRLELFEALGVDAALVIPFDKERSQQPAEEFVRELTDTLRPVAVVVGEDFRFGHKAKGDVALLRRLGERFGFTVEGLSRRVDAELDRPAQAEAVSSTVVRQRLEEGDVAGANELLGRLFEVEGTVVEGAHRGRELGYPTANVPPSPGMALPADGVYAGWLRRVDDGTKAGTPLPAAISVGTNPQFGHEPRRVEAYVLDRDDLELYGVRVVVSFVERVRGQQRFDSVEALVAQMGEDVERIRQILDVPRP
ncbi:bifunctional riboflavin kinase/FAD synthetase [Thermasporomyces composti]|jgi:riboflavin kinase/FMN adenylyltransferase|uniref:Riboflavin biosynthesis protein n=1 Tax=Thermasporomyces composti TaxID=696763 RepID=A0A3D9V0U9_THECX|nr:bifunctional riboflavin kinase/FAD synthetase [Thermasporomyces composti]REF35147.1 FMN adenylyltransferase /riboflavin kinase [Thermasporomyces composti]